MSGVLAQSKVPQIMSACMSQEKKNFAVTLGFLTYNCTAGPSMQVGAGNVSQKQLYKRLQVISCSVSATNCPKNFMIL